MLLKKQNGSLYKKVEVYIVGAFFYYITSYIYQGKHFVHPIIFDMHLSLSKMSKNIFRKK